MTQRQAILFCSLAILTCVGPNGLAQDVLDGRSVFKSVTVTNVSAQLTSTNERVRLLAATEQHAQRSDLIEQLLAITAGTNSFDTKMHAVLVLGEYRAAEAVPFLVENVEREADWLRNSRGLFMSPTSFHRENYEYQTGPITAALTKIGLPAIPALIEHIAASSDAKLAAKYASILSTIDGPEMAKIRLKMASDAETTAERKLRLQDAVKTIEAAKAR